MTSATLDPFQRERQRLIALAYRMLGERAAAEDIVQTYGCAGRGPLIKQ